MKSIFKILVLGVVPILAVTAVMDLGLAADKGSQLIFQSHMDHQNFISVANGNEGRAVTVLVQYYNDELALVLYYLRIIPGGGNVLIDPFDHEIPGSAKLDEDDMEIPGTGINVSGVFDTMPDMTNDDEGDGINSGRFVIVVTAVGADMGVDVNEDGDIADAITEEPSTDAETVSVGGYRIVAAADDDDDTSVDESMTHIQLITKTVTTGADGEITGIAYDDADDGYSAETNRAPTVNALFPAYLAVGMHGVDNIDDSGILSLVGMGLDASEETKKINDVGEIVDESTKNVADWDWDKCTVCVFLLHDQRTTCVGPLVYRGDSIASKASGEITVSIILRARQCGAHELNETRSGVLHGIQHGIQTSKVLCA